MTESAKFYDEQFFADLSKEREPFDLLLNDINRNNIFTEKEPSKEFVFEISAMKKEEFSPPSPLSPFSRFLNEDFTLQQHKSDWQHDINEAAKNFSFTSTPKVDLKEQPVSKMTERKTFFSFAPMFFAKDPKFNYIFSWYGWWRAQWVKIGDRV
uniref:Uncharacterized protein n=1 Tax=Plectus sambesii TaxID=2011161 RepID=A0A914UIL2_9BILA